MALLCPNSGLFLNDSVIKEIISVSSPFQQSLCKNCAQIEVDSHQLDEEARLMSVNLRLYPFGSPKGARLLKTSSRLLIYRQLKDPVSN